MDTAQYDHLRKLMDLMVNQQFLPPDMGPDRRARVAKALSASAKSLRTQFEEDVKKLEDRNLAQAERERIEKNLEHLADALPELAKGTLSAITAFRSGDAISGSAAIMDICATLAPLLASLSATGGPPGMIVGAIFAILGQILSFFAPESKDLISEIQKLLDEQKAKDLQLDMDVVHDQILIWAKSLRDAGNRVSTAQLHDLLDVQVATNVVKEVKVLDTGIVTKLLTALNWLNKPANQSLDPWPTILNAACQAWADLMAAALTMTSLANTDHMHEQYEAAQKLPDSDRVDAVKTLRSLQAAVLSKLILFKNTNDSVQEKLQDLVPAAQDRGMFWQIDPSKYGYLYAGTNITAGAFPYLTGQMKRLAVAIPRQDIRSPRPTYHVLSTEVYGEGTTYDRTYIGQVPWPYTYKIATYLQLVDGNGKDTAEFHSLSDIWAETAASPDQLWFYTAKDNKIMGYRVKPGENKATPTGYAVTLKSKVASVRVVRHPHSFSDDPADTPDILKGVKSITYGGLVRDNAEIFVDASGETGYVPSPWGGYDGLGVDRHYLWVFGSGGLACATHASLMQGLKARKSPRWMIHLPNHLLYSGNQTPTPPPDPKPLLGLVDLCPCEDGTLVAALYTRSVTQKFYPGSSTTYYHEFTDVNGLYSAVYQTDLQKGTIEVEWTKIGEATGVRVQKLPVFCWSLFERLPKMLDQLAPQLTAST